MTVQINGKIESNWIFTIKKKPNVVNGSHLNVCPSIDHEQEPRKMRECYTSRDYKLSSVCILVYTLI